MSTWRPIAYDHATLGEDGRAILALAASVWGQLSLAQRSTLRRCQEGKLLANTHGRVLGNLRCRGLAEPDTRSLTALGVLVREVGLHITATAGRRAA